MNYHNIKHDDMLNGDGLRVTLFVSGCIHHCPGCQNPETHAPESGIPFNKEAREEIFEELSKDYISGLTISGGDPLLDSNLMEIAELVEDIKIKFPNKTVWIYTGYTIEELVSRLYLGVSNSFQYHLANLSLAKILNNTDVLVEGRYIEKLADVTTPWTGSNNQRVIRNIREVFLPNEH